MRNVLIGVGGVVTVLGLLFLLQGSGVVHGSAMSGNHFWIYAGALIAIVGIVVLAFGFRTTKR
jgi:Na+/melibiose symporter-like transporter